MRPLCLGAALVLPSLLGAATQIISPSQPQKNAPPTEALQRPPLPAPQLQDPTGLPLSIPSEDYSTKVREEIETIIVDQIKALSRNDYSKAYYAYTTRDFQRAVPEQTFKRFAQQSVAFIRNKSVHLDDISFKNGIIEVKGSLQAYDGQIARIRYEFAKEQGDWKIRAIYLIPIAPQIKN
jgi:hypothetical protein